MASRRCSARLQRLIVSFATDHSLSQSRDRLLEHHGVEVCESVIDRTLARHAARARDMQPKSPVGTLASEGAETIVTGADGTSIPVWSYDPDPPGGDRRKAKKREFKEMRLFVSRVKGRSESRYAGGFVDMEQAAALWSHCVAACGWSPSTRIHGVFDGAEWIRLRFEEQFGRSGSWLVDFFHLGGYVAAAGKSKRKNQCWLSERMSEIKRSDIEPTIAWLAANLEDQDLPDQEAPVRSALRYVQNRLEHLDYAKARSEDLPIGSRMTEGAHRHVLHPKLKIAGAWNPDKAHNVAQLRLIRANGQWESLWQSAAA